MADLPAEVPAACRCGHVEAAHFPDHARLCHVCGVSAGVSPCMGWWPPGAKTARVELVEHGQPVPELGSSSKGPGEISPPDLDSHAIGGLTDVEADRFTEAIAPGPPDLRQAIQAATTAAAIALSRHSIEDPIADWTTMAKVAVEAAWQALGELTADLELVETDRDHAQNVAEAYRAEIADLQRRLAQADRNTYDAQDQVELARANIRLWIGRLEASGSGTGQLAADMRQFLAALDRRVAPGKDMGPDDDD